MSADLVVQHRLGGPHDRRQLGVTGRVGAELQEGRLQEGDQARPGGRGGTSVEGRSIWGGSGETGDISAGQRRGGALGRCRGDR